MRCQDSFDTGPDTGYSGRMQYDARMTLRATADEVEKVKAEAEARGMSISRYLIACGLDARRRRLALQVDSADMRAQASAAGNFDTSWY